MEVLRQAIDVLLHIDIHLAALAAQYGVWMYSLLFCIIFAETGLVVTPFLPGDSLLFAIGALCANGTFDISLIIVLLCIAAILGDALNYSIGKRLGTKPFENGNSKIFKRQYLEKTERFYEQHGAKTIVLARFMPIVRTFAPFVAGIGNMQYSRFALYNVSGAIVWICSLTSAGYFFGEIPAVKQNFGLVIVGIVVVSVLPGIIETVRHYVLPKKT